MPGRRTPGTAVIRPRARGRASSPAGCPRPGPARTAAPCCGPALRPQGRPTARAMPVSRCCVLRHHAAAARRVYGEAQVAHDVLQRRRGRCCLVLVDGAQHQAQAQAVCHDALLHRTCPGGGSCRAGPSRRCSLTPRGCLQIQRWTRSGRCGARLHSRGPGTGAACACCRGWTPRRRPAG